MAETRAQRQDEIIARLSADQQALHESQQGFQTQMLELGRSVATISGQLDQLLRLKAPEEGQSSQTPVRPSWPYQSLKLDVPRFDGTDPVGWIFKITQFFSYHRTPEAQRITIASFYLDGPTLS